MCLGDGINQIHKAVKFKGLLDLDASLRLSKNVPQTLHVLILYIFSCFNIELQMYANRNIIYKAGIQWTWMGELFASLLPLLRDGSTQKQVPLSSIGLEALDCQGQKHTCSMYAVGFIPCHVCTRSRWGRCHWPADRFRIEVDSFFIPWLDRDKIIIIIKIAPFATAVRRSSAIQLGCCFKELKRKETPKYKTKLPGK